jgi:hypothetical protein
MGQHHVHYVNGVKFTNADDDNNCDKTNNHSDKILHKKSLFQLNEPLSVNVQHNENQSSEILQTFMGNCNNNNQWIDNHLARYYFY